MSNRGRPFFLDKDGAVHEMALEGCVVPLRVELKNGQLLSTNYYASPLNRNGKMVAVFGGDTCHLILPARFSSGTFQGDFLAEIKSSEYSVASYGFESPMSDFCFELMFEDHSQDPYSVQISRTYLLNHYLTVAYHAQTDFKLKIYGDSSLMVLRQMDLRVRFAPYLPYAKEWNDKEYSLSEHENEQVAAITEVYSFLNDAQMDQMYFFRAVAKFIRQCTSDYDWDVIKEVMYEAWYTMINEHGIPFERIEIGDMNRIMNSL